MSNTDDIDPQAGRVQMHSGCTLYWETNAAGGRTYTSDEIPTGVEVWDTALVDFATLCEAFSMEIALQGMERRATRRRERARQDLQRKVLQSDMGPNVDDDAPVVRPTDAGPCPNCGALGCWTPCPHEPPLPDGPDVPDGPESAGFAPGFELRAEYTRADFPSLTRRTHAEEPMTHAEVTLRVHLIRARDQLLRYSSEDPMAAEITKLLADAP